MCLRIVAEIREIYNKPYNGNQYLIAALVTVEEINDPSATFFNGIDVETLSEEEIKYIRDEKLLRKGRVVTVLPKFEPKDFHTEARILDPFGEFRQQLQESNFIPEEKFSFIAQLKEKFKNDNDEDYILVLFSHLMPCDDKGHRCAALIRHYVETTGDNIIVSYEAFPKYEDFQVALSKLFGTKKIWFIGLRFRQKLASYRKSIFGKCFKTYDDNENNRYKTRRTRKREKNRLLRLENDEGRSDREPSSRKKKKSYDRDEKLIQRNEDDLLLNLLWY
ncbi:uncharacterized protein LOC128212890 [Mya arenaria]|uniref:uncharacterized protein LOC128212890 n=1 Tax=Mya arenaria TaxID=6604 RepID=UPI0022E5EED0|nr:uncharacterized protein LOC128212890 [Mya arenaria]